MLTGSSSEGWVDGGIGTVRRPGTAHKIGESVDEPVRFSLAAPPVLASCSSQGIVRRGQSATPARSLHRPRAFARDLLILPGTIIDSYALAPSYRQLAEIERCADEHGYRVMIGQSHGELEKIEAYAGDFIAKGVDGVVCISHSYPETGRPIAELFLQLRNVVCLGLPLSSAAEANWITIDHASAARELVEHFARTGRRRIALLGGNDRYQSSRDRKRGYQEAITALPSDLSPPLLIDWDAPREGEPVPAWEQRIGTQLLAVGQRNGLDALLAPNDVAALQAIRALTAVGLRVPEDVAVSG